MNVEPTLDAPFSWVDLEDVAQVAARVLTEDEHAGAIYELAGPEVLTPTQVAGKFAQVLGKEIKAERLEMRDWRLGAEKSGMNAYALETLTKMFAYYDSFGLWGNSRVLRDLLQRPCGTLEGFISRVYFGAEE